MKKAVATFFEGDRVEVGLGMYGENIHYGRVIRVEFTNGGYNVIYLVRYDNGEMGYVYDTNMKLINNGTI